MRKYLSALFLFFIFLVIYYSGSFTKIPFADCVGFVLDAEKGKFMTTATATTHFLYINTVILIKNVTGLNGIEASRLLVVFSGAATVSVIYLTVKSITKTEWVSLTAAFVFGFSFSFWRNAEIVEVYTYNTLWISLFFFSMIKTFIENKKQYIVWAGIFLGISLWVHIQNILLIPAFLLFLLYFKAEKKYFYSSLLVFVLLFASLFILNMSQGLSFKSPYSSDQGNWVEESFSKTSLQYVKDFFQSFAYLIYNFNLFTFFGVMGAVFLYKSNRKMFFVFFAGSLCVYGFSTFYAVSDNYVFFLPFNIIFALSVGYGLSHPKYAALKKVSWVCLLIPIGYLLTYKAVFQTEKGKAFHSFKKYKGGLDYYILPWMNDNAGILEFTIDKKTAPEPINWMTLSAMEYIELLKSKGYTEEEIKKL
ncbi:MULTISPECIES: protein O-mannosyl-transferase family [unclassified Chryseobacterium]|uniref:protein O-mannosyl-transferase family n=1 Tax=unclassified Chryseobacterium TaxID=2593645 RepID=UPI0030103E4F